MNSRRSTAECASQGLYSGPVAGAVVNSSIDTTISWDSACLTSGTDKIDIYLYAPQSAKANLPIHAWTGIPASKGTYSVKLAPKWWNVTTTVSSSVQLSLNIVNAGNEPWDSANPFGPTWNATYTAPAAGQDPPSDAVQSSGGKVDKLISAFYEAGSLTGAGKVAAIVFPVLVVSVALGIFIRKLHINRNNKTADWAEHMDKRMSRISMDWVSGGDGSAGPVPGSRPASYYPRPSLGVNRGAATGGNFGDNNVAGRGVGAARAMHGLDDMEPDFADEHEMQIRPRGASMYDESAGGDRRSRISFADRTAGDRVSRTSFADNSFNKGHKTSASMPRVGQSGLRKSVLEPNDAYVNDYNEDDMELMSPSLQDGATALGAQDVDKKMHTRKAASQSSVPGVHMMRGDGAATPDDAMRQYAASRGDGQGQSSAMRSLYQARSGLGHRSQASMASNFNEDEVVGYNEADQSDRF